MQDDEALGRAIGSLLDRSSSNESGHATVRIDADEASSTYECWFVGSRRWRVDDGSLSRVRDDATVSSKRHGRVVESRSVAAADSVPYEMQLLFPLRASIWGRGGDDFYLAGAHVEGSLTRLQLRGTEDARTGGALVDLASGCMTYLDLGSTRFTLLDWSIGPLEDAMLRSFGDPVDIRAGRPLSAAAAAANDEVVQHLEAINERRH